jgi:hypothetical protein
MCRAKKTSTYVRSYVLGTAPTKILQQDRRRIAAFTSQPYPTNVGTTVVINVDVASQGSFTFPAGVTQAFVECYGCGGNGGGNVTPGGGGGGGGGYASALIPVDPTHSYLTAVDSDNNIGASSFFDETTSTILVAIQSGFNGVLDAGGAGGSIAGATGVTKYAGGNGANGSDVPNGGGGGGSASELGNGNPGVGTVGGAALGTGGFGGAGDTSVGGTNGSIPGGGGGGAVASNPVGNGADGLVRITYTIPLQQVISISHNPNLVAGKATWNLFGNFSVYWDLHIDVIGDCIAQECYAISNANGVIIEVTDIIADDECEAKGDW